MKSLKIFSLIALMGFLVSCEDWFDVNTDPNNPSDATPELVLPVGMVEAGAVIGGYYNLLGGFWSQYWTQSNVANQYKYIDQYLLDATDFNTQWRDMYANALNDIRFAGDKAKVNQNNSLYLMATVMEAYCFQVMVDLYDEVPYSEALQGEKGNVTAKFDNGQAIYDDLIKRLDEVLALPLNALTENEKKGDFVFAGNMNSWVRFANTLKLKIYMRQMYARPEVAQAGIQKMYADGVQFLSGDAKLDIFRDEKNYDNPLYASDRRGLNVGTNLRASSTLFRYLDLNADPRFGFVIDKAPNGSKGVSLPQGGYNLPNSGSTAATTIALAKLKPTDPVYFISAAESYFLQAEAVAKGWGTGNDASLYASGVNAAFARYGLDATSFVAPGGAYAYPSAGTFEQKQEAIIMQKWVSMAVTQGIESFFETNRTGYPRVSSIPATSAEYPGGQLTYSIEGTTSGKFPKRLIFPKLERDSNPNVPAEKGVTEPVWWDKK